jgi:regulator of sigma E protease
VVRAIDGREVHDWHELQQTLVTSADRTPEGRRRNVFTIERNGELLEITVYPRLAGDERIRRVGIVAAWEMIVHDVAPGSLGEQIGLQPGDRIKALDDRPILSGDALVRHLQRHADQPVALQVERAGAPVTLTIPPQPEADWPNQLGARFTTESKLVYPTPIRQFQSHVSMTFRTLGSLINPQSDIGISKLSGPVGIIRIFHLAAQADIRLVLWFTILVNINLAIFNLLPIPVLDGGHMMFATIARLRGRALPPNFIMTTQSVFMVLLFTMILYVSFFDVRRWARDAARAPAAEAEPGNK